MVRYPHVFMKEQAGEINQEKEMVDVEDLPQGRVYEVGLLFVPFLTEEKVAGLFEELKRKISELDGSVISAEMPYVKNLAYQINVVLDGQKQKFKSGHFCWVKFEVDAEKIATLESGLKANKDIIRFIIVKTTRENTYYSSRPIVSRESEQVDDMKQTDSEKHSDPKPEIGSISDASRDEQIDKSIEELVTE